MSLRLGSLITILRMLSHKDKDKKPEFGPAAYCNKQPVRQQAAISSVTCIRFRHSCKIFPVFCLLYKVVRYVPVSCQVQVSEHLAACTTMISCLDCVQKHCSLQAVWHRCAPSVTVHPVCHCVCLVCHCGQVILHCVCPVCHAGA